MTLRVAQQASVRSLGCLGSLGRVVAAATLRVLRVQGIVKIKAAGAVPSKARTGGVCVWGGGLKV